MRTSIIFLFSFLCLSAIAQTTLTYEQHCYQKNTSYAYHMVDFGKPGQAGEHCVWDFSDLKSLEVMDGEMEIETYATRNDIFPNGDISIKENGTQFIYSNTDSKMVQLGYIAKNGVDVVRHLKPYVKLKFPFSYGDTFSGAIEMETNKGKNLKTGTYTVTADAYGLVILPNGKEVSNTLRIKTECLYNLSNGAKQVLHIYRWYGQYERFPIMVLQETKYVDSNGKSNVAHKAAYNNLISKSASLGVQKEFSITPNPAFSQFSIQISQEEEEKVQVNMYTLGGKLVKNIFDGKLVSGTHVLNVEVEPSLMSPGSYFIKVVTSESSQTQQILIQQ